MKDCGQFQRYSAQQATKYKRHAAHALSFLGVEKMSDAVAHTRQQGGHIPRVVLTLGQRARDLGVGIVAHHKREVSTMEGDTSSVSLTRERGPHTGGSEAQSTTDSDAHTGGSKVMKKTPSFFPCVCVAAHRVHAKDDQRDQPLHGAPHAQKILIKCRILAEALGGGGVGRARLGKMGSGDGEFIDPSALALVPGLGLVVRESYNGRFQVFG